MQAEAGWILVRDSSFVALIKHVTASESAEDLRTRIVRYLAGEAQPEFSEIRILRGIVTNPRREGTINMESLSAGKDNTVL